MLESNEKSILEISTNNPEAKYFLNAYPQAKIQGYILSRNYIKNKIDELREECGEDFKEQEYWKMEYTDQRTNKSLTLWIDPYTEKVVCIIEKILNQTTSIPFGIYIPREKIETKQGSSIKEKIYFYNLNGNDTYYISLKVVKKPPWDIEIDPPAHLYKPMNMPPVVINVKTEPTKLMIGKPDRYPEGVEYIKPDDLGGFVKSKFVEWALKTPERSPITPPITGKFDLVFNVTAKQFSNGQYKVFSSKLINYTIELRE